MNFGGLARRQAGAVLRPTDHRLYSALATETYSYTPAQHDFTAPPPKLDHIPYHISSSVVLSRSPVLTRDPHPFESSFYFYQRRLDARLVLPFTRALYYKQGTLAAAEYKRKLQEFQKTDLYYNPYSRDSGFKDELLAGQEQPGKENYGYDALSKYTVSGEEALEKASKRAEEEQGAKGTFSRPYARETEADRKGDKHALDRKLSRTVYLLVQGQEEKGVAYGEEGIVTGKGGWKFPTSNIIGKESIKMAAERTLLESCGEGMNTWFAGNVPSGHFSYQYSKPIAEAAGPIVGRKTFFMKARILQGQVKIDGNPYGWKDYLWATKEEIEEIVGQRYFYAIRHMLHNR